MLLYVEQKMIYELRTYQVVPGKMAELNARFREITTGLFEKHGVIIIGFYCILLGHLLCFLRLSLLADRGVPIHEELHHNQL